MKSFESVHPIRIVINGFGRIGRSVFRQALQTTDVEVVHINDLNPSVENLAYLAKFDSVYGRLDQPLKVEGCSLDVNGKKISVSHEKSVEAVKWERLDFDILIESTGVVECQDSCGRLIEQSIIPRGICTHSSKTVDKTIIMGANECEFDFGVDRYLSSSICDANAVAPFLRAISDQVCIVGGDVLTLHPWLGYQNLVDGPCRSFAYPGQIEENFALGRASTEALIPKTTSCISAIKDVLSWLPDIRSMSFRVPTPVVSSAIINLQLESSVLERDVLGWLLAEKQKQKYQVFDVVNAPLVSKDFEQTNQSCIIDRRWLNVSAKGTELRAVLWYDNEYAYAARVLDTVRMLSGV